MGEAIEKPEPKRKRKYKLPPSSRRVAVSSKSREMTSQKEKVAKKMMASRPAWVGSSVDTITPRCCSDKENVEERTAPLEKRGGMQDMDATVQIATTPDAISRATPRRPDAILLATPKHLHKKEEVFTTPVMCKTPGRKDFCENIDELFPNTPTTGRSTFVVHPNNDCDVTNVLMTSPQESRKTFVVPRRGTGLAGDCGARNLFLASQEMNNTFHINKPPQSYQQDVQLQRREKERVKQERIEEEERRLCPQTPHQHDQQQQFPTPLQPHSSHPQTSQIMLQDQTMTLMKDPVSQHQHQVAPQMPVNDQTMTLMKDPVSQTPHQMQIHDQTMTLMEDPQQTPRQMQISDQTMTLMQDPISQTPHQMMPINDQTMTLMEDPPQTPQHSSIADQLSSTAINSTFTRPGPVRRHVDTRDLLSWNLHQISSIENHFTPVQSSTTSREPRMSSTPVRSSGKKSKRRRSYNKSITPLGTNRKRKSPLTTTKSQLFSTTKQPPLAVRKQTPTTSLDGVMKRSLTTNSSSGCDVTTTMTSSSVLVKSRRSVAASYAAKHKPKGIRKVKKPLKGVPLSKLILQADSPSPSPTSTPAKMKRKLPSVNVNPSRNQFYDVTWKEKEERAYKSWINFILTPHEFKTNQQNATLTTTASTQSTAINKETASWRTYQQQRTLDQLRRSAHRLLHNDVISDVIARIEQLVDDGGLQVRNDEELWRDIGSRKTMCDLLMSYNPMWMRIALEVCFGETVPMVTTPSPHHSDVTTTSVRRFIEMRVLNDYELQRKYAHPTVPHSYRTGYAKSLSKHTLKKTLQLVYFLDCAKQRRLLRHDPCLFVKNQTKVKSSSEILTSLSRHFLCGEGDVIKHLSYVGYKVNYKQNFLDEFEYGVSNIAVELRDGIRLCRIVEILFNQFDLSKQLRVPANSRLQKVHNVQIALKKLTSNSISVTSSKGKLIAADHIVSGNREMTLSLLWNISAHFEIVHKISIDKLKEEIEFLKKNLKLRNKIVRKTPSELYDENDDHYGEEKVDTSQLGIMTSLLLEWCRCVCAFYIDEDDESTSSCLQVTNYSGSFADGRVLSLLISHYQPHILPQHRISHHTRYNIVQQPGDSLPPTSDFEAMLRNEKQNFTLVKTALYDLGLPDQLLKLDDFVDNIINPRIIKLIVAYLYTTLFEAQFEHRSARVIQIAWKAYRKRIILVRQQKELEEKQRKSSLIITNFMRMFAKYRSYERLKAGNLLLQRKWRSTLLARTERNNFLQFRHQVIVLQSHIRRHLATKYVQEMKRDVMQIRHQSATIIQRRWRVTLNDSRKREAVMTIQRWWRTQYKKRQEEKYFINLLWRIGGRCGARAAIPLINQAAVKIQTKWRCYIQERKYQQIRRSCMLIQQYYRNYRYQKMYLSRVIRIQALYRGWSIRRNLSGREAEMLESVKEINRRATLDGCVKIGTKFNSAISDLLQSNQFFSKIVTTLVFIDDKTRIMNECCARLMEDDSVAVLFHLVDKCGRDYESSQVILYSLQIMTTLSKNQNTRDKFLSIMDEHGEKIVRIMFKFEDKSGRDKRTKPVFIGACRLLSVYLESSQHRIQKFLENKQNIFRLGKMKEDMTKNYEIQKRRKKEQTRDKARKSVGYLAPAMMARNNNRRSRQPLTTNMSLMNKTMNKTRSSSYDDDPLESAFFHFRQILAKLNL